MAPKNKGTKLALGDFLNDESTGKMDWADDVGDLNLQTLAPIPGRNERSTGRGADWLSSQPDRGERDRSFLDNSDRGFERGPPRQELPLPSAPPYTAFIGNLSFDVREPEVEEFFSPSKCTSVRMVNGADGRAKGFGYVEFETLDGLKDALTRSGTQWMGRTVRVSVAEPRDARPGASSVAEEASQWRRAGPLPPSDGGMGARRNDRPGFGRQESGPSGFDTMENRSGFGQRFTPSTPRELQQGPARRAVPESLEPSVGDNASDWRTGKPTSESLVSPAVSRKLSGSPATLGAGVTVDGAPRGPMRTTSRGDATEIDERFASQDRLGFGSKFVPTPPDSPSVAKRPGFGGIDRRSSNAPGGITSAAGGASAAAATAQHVPPTPTASDGAENWRSSRKASVNGNSEGGGSPATAPAPAQRKKLELKPRSVPTESPEASAVLSPTSSSNKPSPFGLAKPIDASERDKEIEAKIAAQEKERREEEKKRKEKMRIEREKAQSQAPSGPKADRNRSKGAASEKGSETSSNTAAPPDAIGSEIKVTSPKSSKSPKSPRSPKSSSSAPTGPKQATKTGAWGGGRKPSGALVAGQQSIIKDEANVVNGNGPSEEQNMNNGTTEGTTEIPEATKAIESITVNDS